MQSVSAANSGQAIGRNSRQCYFREGEKASVALGKANPKPRALRAAILGLEGWEIPIHLVCSRRGHLHDLQCHRDSFCELETIGTEPTLGKLPRRAAESNWAPKGSSFLPGLHPWHEGAPFSVSLQGHLNSQTPEL